MILNDARVENFNGIRFYEQDILYDDHVYTESIEASITLDYLSPGFGVALLNNEGASLDEQNEIFLFRFGNRESSVIYKYGELQKTIKRSSNMTYAPLQNFKILFQKEGKNIKIKTEGQELPLLEYVLPNNNWDKYSLGFYSNAGNTIKEININAPTPKRWVLNMYNTDGGYVKFSKSELSFEGCKNNAEFEQEKIELKKGMYFLRYDEIEPGITPYVFLAGDESIYAKSKNILVANSYFVLEQDTAINLRFSGKTGTIKNISICENLYDIYIPSQDESAKISGSNIKINLKDIEFVKWTGRINELPDLSTTMLENEKPYVIKIGEETKSTNDTNVRLKTEYTYLYDTSSNSLRIEETSNPMNIVTVSLKTPGDFITILNNMNVVLTEFKIKKNGNDEIFDYIKEEGLKKYISDAIESPILVIDNDNVPYDLSSSYRVLRNGDETKYVFTIREREIFKAERRIVLDKRPIEDYGKIFIYGIRKEDRINMNKFYDIRKNGILHDITAITPNYVVINRSNIEMLNAKNKEIVFKNVDDFEHIIVDYEKANSYCINHIGSISAYEVELSSNSDNFTIMYDETALDSDFKERETYLPIKAENGTNIKPSNDKYIILRKGFENYENFSAEAQHSTDQPSE